jgi:AcrR family transcriptional regulator
LTERQRTAGSEPAGSGTSESQLVRYFGGKAGLLDAIFDEAAFDRDDELATLFLFEGRRIRGESKVRLSAGFVEFHDVAQRLIRRGQKDGSFSSNFDATALSAALMGAVGSNGPRAPAREARRQHASLLG